MQQFLRRAIPNFYLRTICHLIVRKACDAVGRGQFSLKPKETNTVVLEKDLTLVGSDKLDVVTKLIPSRGQDNGTSHKVTEA